MWVIHHFKKEQEGLLFQGSEKENHQAPYKSDVKLKSKRENFAVLLASIVEGVYVEENQV